MIDIGVGIGFDNDPMDALESALKEALANKKIHKKLSLALLFNTYGMYSLNLAKQLAMRTDNTPILGANAPALISRKGITTHGLAVALISFPEDIYFNTALSNFHIDMPSGEAFADKLLYGFKNMHRSLGLIFFDRIGPRHSEFISGMQNKLGWSFPFIAAATAEENNPLAGNMYFNQQTLNNVCTGLLCGGKINLGIGVKHGWRPLGKPHNITKSHDNVIEQIDNQPAAKLYMDYLECSMARIEKELRQITSLYPLGMRIPQNKEYLLQHIHSMGNNGSLICHEKVVPDSSVRVMISTKETCLEAVEQALEEAKFSLSSQPPMRLKKDQNSKFALIINSTARNLSLKHEFNKEMDLLQKNLDPSTPFLGIYACGEIAPLTAGFEQGKAYAQNQSVCVLLIEG